MPWEEIQADNTSQVDKSDVSESRHLFPIISEHKVASLAKFMCVCV